MVYSLILLLVKSANLNNNIILANTPPNLLFHLRTQLSIITLQGIVLSLFLSIILVKNSNADDEQEKEQGINDAKKSNLSIHQAYLQCYALLKPDKLKCSENIISKNKIELSQNLLSSNIYITSFAYEAERLGFLWFLQNERLLCDAIDEGPSYHYKREAYEVLCRNGNKYYIRFDYSENLWHLKKD